MTRRARGAALAFLIAVTAVVPQAHSRQKQIAAASVELDVFWSGAAGSDAFRDELRRSLAAQLATTCFASVTLADTPPAPAASDLILAVALSNAQEETEFDDSIAGVLQPGDPAQELRRVARCSVTIDLMLTTRAQGTLVVRKHFTVTSARRPLVVGEDSQAGAREDAIYDAARQVSGSLGCGGAKLARKIRDALVDHGEAPGAR